MKYCRSLVLGLRYTPQNLQRQIGKASKHVSGGLKAVVGCSFSQNPNCGGFLQSLDSKNAPNLGFKDSGSVARARARDVEGGGERGWLVATLQRRADGSIDLWTIGNSKQCL